MLGREQWHKYKIFLVHCIVNDFIQHKIVLISIDFEPIYLVRVKPTWPLVIHLFVIVLSFQQFIMEQ